MKLNKLALTLSLSIATFGLVACSSDKAGGNSNDGDDEEVTLHVAALESAYGSEVWEEIAENYEKLNDNITVDLTVEKNLEEVIRPEMQAGDYPDVFLLATDREEALTETVIKENGVENISDVLTMDVPGEDVKVEDKLLDGFTDTLATNPYNDGDMYLAPMFYSPAGLFYNESLLEEYDWDVPNTWDEMFALGDETEKEDISLFTYPIAGYFDTLIGSMLFASGKSEFFDSAMTYEEGVWKSDEATQVFETIEKLSDYTHPNTISNANPNDFTKNQQLILDNEAVFMPNGSWVVEEMEEAPREDGFEWGMMPTPSFEDDGDRYAFTFFEQMWIPSEAENIDAAKEFLAYMYSDEASDIFLDAGAVQPIEGIVDKLEDEKEIYYSIYDEGDVLPAIGTFATTEPVPGADISEELYEKVDSVMSGKVSVEEWQQDVEEVSDKLRPKMK